MNPHRRHNKNTRLVFSVVQLYSHCDFDLAAYTLNYPELIWRKIIIGVGSFVLLNILLRLNIFDHIDLTIVYQNILFSNII